MGGAMSDASPRLAMRRFLLRRISLSVLVCFLQTAAAAVWLKADGPLVWVFAYCGVVEALFVLRLLYSDRGPFASLPARSRADRLSKLALTLLFLFGAVVIIIGLDITPASAYLAWFQLVREGVAGGTLAYMFTVKFAFFAALFGGLLMVSSVFFSIFNLLAVDLLLCAVLLGKSGLAVVGVLLFVVAIGQRALVRNRRLRTRAVAAVLQLTVVAAVVAIPLSFLHLPNRLIDDLFSVRMEGFVAAVFPNFPFLYNVPGYGYSLASSKIGDRPALTSRPVFQITAPEGSTVYIRTGVYDTFTGTGWELSNVARRTGEHDIQRFESTLNNRTAVSTDRVSFKVLIDFYSSLPHTLGTVAFRFPNGNVPQLGLAGLGSGFILDAPLRRGSEIEDLIARPSDSMTPIVLRYNDNPFVSGLFGRGRTRSYFRDPGTGAVQVRDPDGDRDGTFGRADGTSSATQSDGTFSGIPLPGVNYEGNRRDITEPTPDNLGQYDKVNAPVVDANRAGFSGEGGAGTGGFEPRNARISQELAVASAQYGLQFGRYVLTPWERQADLEAGEVSSRLIGLARQLGAGKSKADALRAIRSYLVDNFQYSLSTTVGGPYKDAVSNFLFDSKTGFCVQFASAFVILARLNDIPARYVTGFLANLPNGESQMTVTGLSAHSWAETWNNQLGWVTQEATPPMIAAAEGQSNILQAYNPSDSSFTQRQLQALLGGRLNQGQASTKSNSTALSSDLAKIADPFPGAPYIVACAVAALLLLLVLIRLAYLRMAPVEIRFERVVRKIAARSTRRGFPDPAEKGWREWSQEVIDRSRGRAPVAERAAALIHRSFFAGKDYGNRPRGRDVTFLRRLYSKLLRRRKRPGPAPRPKAPVS